MFGKKQPVGTPSKVSIRQVSKVTLVGYGMGHFFNDLCSAIWFTYTLVYYEQVIGFSSTMTGTVMLIGQVADAVSTPIVGILADRFTFIIFKCFGKRKSWYTFGTIIVICSIPFVFSPCQNCEDAHVYWKLVYYAFFVIVFQIGWAIVQTVHLALVTDLSSSSQDRTALLSIRNTFTIISNFAVYSIFVALLLNQSSSDAKFERHDANIFQIMTGIVVVVGSITSTIFTFLVHENDETMFSKMREGSQINSVKSVKSETHMYWFKKLLLYHVAAIYMLTRIYCNVLQSFIVLYISKSLFLDRYNIALIPLVMYMAGFASSLMSDFLTHYFGKKTTYIIGVSLAISACIWMELDTEDLYKTYFVYITAILLGAGSSLMLIIALAITSDLIGSNTGNSAFIYGLVSLLDKLSCGIIIWCLEKFVPEDSSRYFIHSLSLTCSISSLLGGILVILLPQSLVTEQVFEESEPPVATESVKSSQDT